MQIGRAAGESLRAGEDGRYMRALKSVLGTSLFHESRRIGGKRQTLADVVTAFLAEAKARAEAAAGHRFDRVLSGRPVHFHKNDSARDARAEADLLGCYRAAGFRDVSFRLEPEAAALAVRGRNDGAETVLIVDIGGGTSDFSVVRWDARRLEVLASHGIRLGGTDFDQALSLGHAMPHLGLEGALRREFGPGTLPVPRAMYVDLSTWAKIPFLYTPETLRAVDQMARRAVAPAEMARLKTVVEDELGHDLAFAVEAGKIAANGGTADGIDLSMAAPGLTAPLSEGQLTATLAPMRAELSDAMAETLARAGVSPEQVDAVVLVGGSSLMAFASQTAEALCPSARLQTGAAVTAIVDGLALASGGPAVD